MNIEKLSDYISKISDDELLNLSTKIYEISISNNSSYPQHKEWFFLKHLPGVIKGTRDILFVQNDESEIIAIACLKNEDDEKKICTLYVKEEYRNKGIGTALIEKSMDYLQTDQPFLTITEASLNSFVPMINKYGWKLTEIVDGVYNPSSKEYCYNGFLTKKEKPMQKEKI